MSLVVLIKLLKMAVSKVGQLKPFMIEEKKDGPNNTVSGVTANKWQGCMLVNIKKEANWLLYGHSSHANFFFFIFVQMKRKYENPAV